MQHPLNFFLVTPSFLGYHLTNDLTGYELFFTCFLIIVGAMIVVALLFALANWKLQSNYQMVKSKVNDGSNNLKPFQYYYLPDTEITLQLDFDLEVSYADKGIDKVKLADYTIEIVTRTVPDLRKPLVIEYQSNLLFNDELDIKVTEQGLLNSTIASSEDQTAQIITDLADAPRELTNHAINRMVENSPPTNSSTSNITHVEIQKSQKKLVLKGSELSSGKHEKWGIELYVSNSQKGSSKKEKFGLVLTPKIERGKSYIKGEPEEFMGLVTRRKVNAELEVVLFDEMQNEYQGQVSTAIVDTTVDYPIELKRKPFVKKKSNLVFKEGFLLQHKAINPSSYHGFISIPIDIGKAIMSIPGQLFSLKVQRIKDQTTLATEQLALVNSQNSLKNAALGQKVALSKLKSDLQTNFTKAELERAKFELSVATATDEITKAMKKNNHELVKVRKAIEEAKADIDKLKAGGA